MTVTPLSLHSVRRSRERLGLGARATHRLALRAQEHGVRAADVNGQARRWIDAQGMNHHTTPVVYGEYAFVFGNHNVLVTVLHVPRELRDAFRKALRRKAVGGTT